jgi:hypothetical protein
MTPAVFSEMLDDFQHSTRLIPDSRSLTFYTASYGLIYFGFRGYSASVNILFFRLQAITATELDKIFSGNKPCQLGGIIPLMMETEMVSEK